MKTRRTKSRRPHHSVRSRKALKAKAKNAKLKTNYFEARCAKLETDVLRLRDACVSAARWFKFYVGPGDAEEVRDELLEALRESDRFADPDEPSQAEIETAYENDIAPMHEGTDIEEGW